MDNAGSSRTARRGIAFARRAGSAQPPSIAGFALRPLRWRKEKGGNQDAWPPPFAD